MKQVYDMDYEELRDWHPNDLSKINEYKCIKCGNQAEVWFPYTDHNNPGFPYCQECSRKQVEMVEKIEKVYNRLLKEAEK